MIKQQIKNGIIFGISTFFTIFVCFIGYAAITNIWTNTLELEVTTESTLSVERWNKLLGNFEFLKDNTVGKTGDETIGGIKTFSSFPVTPSSAPTTNYQVANKKYVDDKTVSLNIPSGAVMAFYLTSCPTGWRPADGTNLTPDLRGQFIRGLNTFNAGLTTRTDGRQDPVNRSLGDYQDDAFQGHNRRISINHWYSPGTKAKPTLDVSINSDNNNNANTTILQTTNGDYFIDGIYGTPRVANETRSKNVALIYCVKN